MDYPELDRLIAGLEKTVEDSNPQKGYWRELWSLVGEINSGFKGARYPGRDDRDRAWARFQELVGRAKERSEESRARIEKNESEWQRRQDKSRYVKGEIEAKVARARPSSDFERLIGGLVLFPIRVVDTIISKLLGIRTPSELEEIREELLACNKILQEAWSTFNQRRGELLPGDKQQAYDGLQEARRKLDEAWDRWKERKASLHESRQREWEERQRAREARQEERERKRREFVAKVGANIAKLEDKLERANSALYKQERHLEELRDKYYSAWNDSFKERCSEWIDECETKISDIKEHIDRLEGWLREERDKIS